MTKAKGIIHMVNPSDGGLLSYCGIFAMAGLYYRHLFSKDILSVECIKCLLIHNDPDMSKTQRKRIIESAESKDYHFENVVTTDSHRPILKGHSHKISQSPKIDSGQLIWHGDMVDLSPLSSYKKVSGTDV